ncbi:MAG TPA: hypothetical protein VEK76_07950 [Candidatus Binatia bacterium]|nr:hypothetical protein [Candidatus Binatia bacterium]
MAVSAQRRRRILVAVVAALIAAGAFVLALTYYGKSVSSNPSGTLTPTATPAPSTVVVVASSTIEQGQPLTAANLKTAAVPTSELSPLVALGGTDYTSVASLTKTPEYALQAIPAGMPVLSSMLTTSSTGPVASTPAIPGTDFTIPNGYVGVSLPYTTASSQGEMDGDGTGGYIVAGDRIDILAEVDPINPTTGQLTGLMGTMYWAYQNVLVLAVGAPSATSAPAPSPSASAAASPSSAPVATGTGGLIMVAVPQQDGAALTFMKDAKNVFLQYLIVAKGDYLPSGTPGPAPITGPGSAGQPQPISAGNVNTFYGG